MFSPCARVTCALSAISGALLLAFAFQSGAQAQTVQGVVTGSVTDSSGALIPGADLTLVNDGTLVSQQEKSGTSGVYRFGLVPPGTYSLTTKAQGFTTREIKKIIVDASTTVPVNVALSVATAQTVIEISTQETIVQTASSDLSTTIDQRFIQSMPLLTRNVFDLAFAAPAVSQGMNFNAAAGGARESGTTNMLNGADNNDNFSEGSHNVTPPMESVAEFTVLTNNMSAQYGHAAGALVSAIQKSGTNKFHGAAYEFNRNTDFDASQFFDNRAGNPKQHYVRNQFGGEVDGPIIKDKTFFMGTFDRLDNHTGNTNVDASHDPRRIDRGHRWRRAERTGIPEALSRPSPRMLCAPPRRSTIRTAVGHIGCINVPDPLLTGQNTFVARVDHNFSEKDRLSITANVVRYGYTDKWGGGYQTSSTSPSPTPTPSTTIICR